MRQSRHGNPPLWFEELTRADLAMQPSRLEIDSFDTQLSDLNHQHCLQRLLGSTWRRHCFVALMTSKSQLRASNAFESRIIGTTKDYIIETRVFYSYNYA